MNDPMVMQLMLVDAFARQPFMGNPAIVCWIPDKWPSNDWLQRFAAEMNQSETAFVGREGEHFRWRWFSPVTEVDLCGHATLAATHSILSWGFAERGLLTFQTKSGQVTAEPLEDGMIRLNFPVESAIATPMPAGLTEALGTRSRVVFVGKNRFDYLVHLATPTDVSTLRPDMLELAKIDCRGVIVTAAGEGHYDFVSRFFAPRVGIPEDPVTGSAHCCLAPYWSVRSGRTRMLGYQASQRGGEVRVEVVAQKRVLISGKALTITTGQVAVA